MKRLGYLTQVNVKGEKYIYLTEYIGQQQYTARREKNVYSFGINQKALFKMRMWEKIPELFPQKLQNLGYGKKDLLEWIKTLETGKSKTGRSQKFKVN